MTGPPSLTLHGVSGGGQIGVAGRALAEPLIVEVRDEGSRPVPGVIVTWSTPAGSIDPTEVTTDAAGRASVTWTLGQAVGEQEATAALDVKSFLTFRASAQAAGAAKAELVSEDTVQGIAGRALAEPLEVRVLDDVGAPVAGVEVGWSVTAGGGSVEPASVLTDADGTARGIWSLGNGVGWQVVEVQVDTLPALEVRAHARQVVGPAGGTVEDVDGVVRLQIQAGALAAEQEILVEPAPYATGSGLVEGTAYEFSPSGLAFAIPATLSIALKSTEARQAAANNGVAIQRLGETGWTELTGSAPTSAGDSLTARTNGFSVYGVVSRRSVAAVEVTPAKASTAAVGTSTSFAVVLRDASGNVVDSAVRSVDWSSDQPEVATVDASGQVTSRGDGQARITARTGDVSGSATFIVH